MNRRGLAGKVLIDRPGELQSGPNLLIIIPLLQSMWALHREEGHAAVGISACPLWASMHEYVTLPG